MEAQHNYTQWKHTDTQWKHSTPRHNGSTAQTKDSGSGTSRTLRFLDLGKVMNSSRMCKRTSPRSPWVNDEAPQSVTFRYFWFLDLKKPGSKNEKVLKSVLQKFQHYWSFPRCFAKSKISKKGRFAPLLTEIFVFRVQCSGTLQLYRDLRQPETQTLQQSYELR